MKAGLSLIFIMTLLYLCSCSDSESDQQTPTPQIKSSMPLQNKIKPMGMSL
jgi:hypothetical protein